MLAKLIIGFWTWQDMAKIESKRRGDTEETLDKPMLLCRFSWRTNVKFISSRFNMVIRKEQRKKKEGQKQQQKSRWKHESLRDLNGKYTL